MMMCTYLFTVVCCICLSQLGRIYLDMLNVYKVLSENISNAVSINGNEQPYVAIMTPMYVVYMCMILCASSDTVNVSV